MREISEVAPGLANAGSPLEGVATAGQPNEEHLRRLVEDGYKTVIDLRTLEEDRGLDEKEAVQRAGMEYISIPVDHEKVEDETFEQFREHMTNPGRRPALVHCSSANRVGALLVPYLILDEGMTREEALGSLARWASGAMSWSRRRYDMRAAGRPSGRSGGYI